MAKKKNEGGFDPTEIVEDIIRRDFDQAVFDLVDDSDFKPAKNIHDFLTNRKFLNIKPFPRQLQLCLHLFTDYCPICSDKNVVEDMFKQEMDWILERIQLLEYGRCPKCKKTRGKRLIQRLIHVPDEISACCGQRSGKSVTVAMIANYQLHRFLCLPNPSNYFGLLPNTVLHMNFVALTWSQADDTLWQPFQALYDNCEWFKEYNRMLDHYSAKHDIYLYDNKKTFIFYNHKRLVANPMGPDKRKLRGPTRFFSAIDEIGWFWGDGIKYDADEVYTALERSLRTIRSAAREKHNRGFYNAPIAISANISSPSTANDKIMRLIRGGERDKTKVVCHYATWEFNPTIEKKDLSKEFNTNPITAARDYGADPPLSDSPFFQDAQTIRKAIDSHNIQTQMVSWKEEEFSNKFGDVNRFLTVNISTVNKRVKRILSIDTGYNNNAFALVVQHLTAEDKAKIDFALEIRSSQDAPVNFVKVYENVIIEIVEKLNIRMAVFDRWQSITLSNMLTEKGVETEQYSLRWDDFQAARSRLNDGKMIFPKTEVPFEEIERMEQDYETLIRNRPITHLILQFLTVREVGRKVEKGEGFDDDIFRAVILGQSFLFDEDYKKYFEGEDDGSNRSTRQLGRVYSKSMLMNQAIGQKIAGRSDYLLVKAKGSMTTPLRNMSGYKQR